MDATGGQLHKKFTRVAASRMQIPADFIHVALHATSGHSGTICMQLAASRIQFWHALAASTVQNRQFFESTLPEQLFE
jgi:hypothetical protein